jgi:hypothetical protein
MTQEFTEDPRIAGKDLFERLPSEVREKALIVSDGILSQDERDSKFMDRLSMVKQSIYDYLKNKGREDLMKIAYRSEVFPVCLSRFNGPVLPLEQILEEIYIILLREDEGEKLEQWIDQWKIHKNKVNFDWVKKFRGKYSKTKDLLLKLWQVQHEEKTEWIEWQVSKDETFEGFAFEPSKWFTKVDTMEYSDWTKRLNRLDYLQLVKKVARGNGINSLVRVNYWAEPVIQILQAEIT